MGGDLRGVCDVGGGVVSLPSDALNIGHFGGSVKRFLISSAYQWDKVIL